MSDDRDRKLEGLLDSALAQYGAAEPLHGIEERVLGRLHAERSSRAWWIWGGVTAAALAAVIVVVVLLARPTEKPATPGAHTLSRQVIPVPAVLRPEQAKQEARIRPQRAMTPQHAATMSAATNTPKLDRAPRNQGVPPVVPQVMTASL